MKARTWVTEILIAVDRLVNAVFRGSADETISARAHRARMAGRPAWANFIDWAFGNPQHCLHAWLYESHRWSLGTTTDEAGMQLVDHMREPA